MDFNLFYFFLKWNEELLAKYYNSMKAIFTSALHILFDGNVAHEICEIGNVNELSERFIQLIRKHIGDGYNSGILRSAVLVTHCIIPLSMLRQVVGIR